MNKKDLETYKKLQEEFIHECDRVAQILRGATECRDMVYAENFILEEESVFWSGDEYWSYGGHEYHSGYFDADYLTMTDEELKAIVDKMNQEYRKKQEKKEKEIEEAERKKRFAEYEKLKKEFDK